MSMRVQSMARTGAAGGLRHPTRVSEDGWKPCDATCSVHHGSRCRCVPFTAGEGPHRLWGTAVFSHGSLGVNLLGGTVPHIGAVAVAIPRSSLARPGRRSATTSVLALVGHKDDELARSMATELARQLGITVVVTAGVHLPRARLSDIAAVLRNAKDVAKTILAQAASARKRRRRGQ